MMDYGFGGEASLFVALHIALLLVVLLDKPRKHGTPENLHVKCSTYLNCLNTWVLQKKVVAIVQSIWFCVKGILSGILFKSLMPVPKASTLQGPNKLPASQREECARQSSPHTFEPATLVNSSSSQDVLWAEKLEQKSHQFSALKWIWMKMSENVQHIVHWRFLDGSGWSDFTKSAALAMRWRLGHWSFLHQWPRTRCPCATGEGQGECHGKGCDVVFHTIKLSHTSDIR